MTLFPNIYQVKYSIILRIHKVFQKIFFKIYNSFILVPEVAENSHTWEKFPQRAVQKYEKKILKLKYVILSIVI